MADPIILAFDTSGGHCAATLLIGGIPTTQVEEMSRGQGERLMVLLEKMLAQAGITWSDLSAIGVGVGPGNFTGIRIGVSAARGLALGLGIPAVGVSMFDTTSRLSNWAPTVVPAPRDQLYVYDPDKMDKPVLTDRPISMPVARSDAFSTAEHVDAIAQIAAQRAGPDTPRPAPLYVRAPDAAPPREKPPVILP